MSPRECKLNGGKTACVGEDAGRRRGKEERYRGGKMGEWEERREGRRGREEGRGKVKGEELVKVRG